MRAEGDRSANANLYYIKIPMFYKQIDKLKNHNKTTCKKHSKIGILNVEYHTYM